MILATALVTYVWHYVVARLFYDDLVRPLIGSDRLAGIAVLTAIVLVLTIRRRARSTR